MKPSCSALRSTTAAGLLACRELVGATREAVAAVVAAVAEKRGVARTFAMALERAARAGICTTRVFAEQSGPAWRPVAVVGVVASRGIGVAARIVVGSLSVMVVALMACDILLNTAAEWSMLHPRGRKR